MYNIYIYIGWSEAPGAFPGAYQTVRDGNNDEFA